jgi:hypothetical protein
MKKCVRPSKEIKSFAEFKSYVKNPTDNFVFGVFNNENDKLYKSYLGFATKYLDDFHLFHSFDVSSFEQSLKLKNFKAPSVIVYYHDFVLTRKESNFRVFDDVSIEIITNYLLISISIHSRLMEMRML